MFNRLNNPNGVFRREIYPDVLWDGNTASWYKHDDMRTVFKDGANRVSYWLDRYNYAVGANIIPNPLNFMNAAWLVFALGVKVDNDSFQAAGGSGGLSNANILWTLNTTYRLRMSVTITAGFQLSIRSLGADVYYTLAGTGARQIIDVCFTVTAIAANGTVLRLSNTGQVDLDYLIIEPIAGNHLIQGTLANQPTWSAANGLLFDGGNDSMKTLPFVFVQPEFIYFVGRQVTWTLNDRFLDGNAVNSGELYQNAVSPEINAAAGIASGANNNLAVNTFGIIRILFGGANSSLQVNQTAAMLGNFGANNMGGFTLGANGTPGQWGNIQVKEIILRRSADNAAVQQQIYDYLRASNGL